MRHKGSITRLFLALTTVIALAFGMVACTQQQPSSSSSASSSSASSASSESAEASSESADSPEASSSSSSAKAEDNTYGKPWTNSTYTGNLPEEAPEAVDNLYLHYNYDYIADHQKGMEASSVLFDTSDEVKDAIIATINDTSITSPELEQLRIFYGQAADIKTLKASGGAELNPYLEAVLNTQSLDELNQLLSSSEFPFSPWIFTTIGAESMRSTVCVDVSPNLLFFDITIGINVYDDTDDELAQEAYAIVRYTPESNITSELGVLGIEDADEAEQRMFEIYDLEKSYGKYFAAGDEYISAEYGALSDSVQFYNIDELQAACPNFPMKGTLTKLGKDKSETFVVAYPEWLEALNAVWTEDNFELLRMMTAVKVLDECLPYIDPDIIDNVAQVGGVFGPSGDEYAYQACDQIDTFGQLLAHIYVEYTIGDQAADKLITLSNDLIDDYIELVEDTPWLNEASKENVIDKLDNMALNVLYPDGGYIDYSKLKLVPTEQGGTLLGNYLIVKDYLNEYQNSLIGQPALASATWYYISPTLQNCFYETSTNSINIFPGFITSSTYTDEMLEEELLGRIGFVIGHEMSHGFDYTGSQFNAYGEGVSIFTDDDVAEFVEKRQNLADYYSTIEEMPGQYCDGIKLSVEAAADLCGMQVVLQHAKTYEGDFDYELFYSSFANMWASTYHIIYQPIIYIDTHPMEYLRMNVNVQMYDEFYDTYGAEEGDSMYLAPEDRIIMWGPKAK